MNDCGILQSLLFVLNIKLMTSSLNPDKIASEDRSLLACALRLVRSVQFGSSRFGSVVRGDGEREERKERKNFDLRIFRVSFSTSFFLYFLLHWIRQ